MAKLKLMKKEWFNWFDKTFLDNITAWTEYYYINPDSQHWISNNLADFADVEETTQNGVTYSVKNNIISYNGTSDVVNGRITLMFKTLIKAGTTIYIYAEYTGTATNLFQVTYDNGWQNLSNNRSYTLERDVDRVTLYLANTSSSYDHVVQKIMVVIGKQMPPAFNPHLIKIEDILGVVDLGSLNYEKSQSGLFLTRGLMGKIKLPPSSDVVLKTIYSPIYNVIKSADITGPLGPNPSPDMVMAVNFEGVIYLNNLSYTDVNEFKQAMTGVYVIFVKKDSPLG